MGATKTLWPFSFSVIPPPGKPPGVVGSAVHPEVEAEVQPDHRPLCRSSPQSVSLQVRRPGPGVLLGLLPL